MQNALHRGDINEGDVLTFGADPMKWICAGIAYGPKGEVRAFSITPHPDEKRASQVGA